MGILNYGYKNVGVEMSMGRNVHGPKCPWVEMSKVELSGVEMSGVEMSVGRNVLNSNIRLKQI